MIGVFSRWLMKLMLKDIKDGLRTYGAKRSLLGAPLGEGALSIVLEHPNKRVGVGNKYGALGTFEGS